MRILRFFCETLNGDRAELDPVQSHHLGKVLRLGVGDSVQVFDGKGLVANATIEQVGRDQVVLRIVDKTQLPPKASGRVILAVSIAKGERFDWMIEKCTELGADHIAAVQYERTVKMGKESALERYKKIALSAAKQCGRLHLPTVSGPDTFKNTVFQLRTRYPQAVLVYGDAEGIALEPDSCVKELSDKIICIGPEGGFSEAELQFFADANARAVCINPNILRIETAAVAFAAILCRTP